MLRACYAAQYHVPDEPMLPFPKIISLEHKYTHYVLDVHDVRSLQQFLQYGAKIEIIIRVSVQVFFTGVHCNFYIVVLLGKCYALEDDR